MPDTIAAEDKKIFHIHTVEDCSAELQAPKRATQQVRMPALQPGSKKIPRRLNQGINN